MNKTPKSPELDLLCKAVHWHINPNSSVKPPAHFDELRAYKLSNKHQVLPWLWGYIDHFNLGTPSFRKKVARKLRALEIEHTLQNRELLNVSSALHKANIKHVVLKGLSIQRNFYKGFVNSRYSDDLDLLISPADLASTHNALVTESYTLRHDHDIAKLGTFLQRYPDWFRWRDITYQKTGQHNHCIDLHWRVADEFTLGSNSESVLNQAEGFKLNDIELPFMPFTHLFVYVCVHGYLDYFFRLRYLADVYAGMHQQEFDYHSTVKLADELGVTNKVLASMSTAYAFFDGPGTKLQIDRELKSANAYAQLVQQRYLAAKDRPARAHPNKAAWSLKDRWNYLARQISTRRAGLIWAAPIITRCKYNHQMLEQWPTKVSPLVWYPMAILLRIFGRKS